MSATHPQAALAVAPVQGALDALCGFVRDHPRLFVLSGAGISTDSGIPGYRNADGAWMRSAPVQWQDFLGDERARQRYWARSMIGWPMIARAQPNAAHRALVELQARGRVERLVTQNVDGLHQRAGSTDVIEMHGSLAQVTCLTCGARVARAALQAILEADNPGVAAASARPLPDGDAALDDASIDSFRVPRCLQCNGMLKPDVVFFGDSVPRVRVAQAMEALERSDAVLVVGSSLMVYSGYRFCLHAAQRGRPIAAVNLGRTRADALLAVKVSAPCGPTLETLCDRLFAH
jgi:NAD-dependent SIR2 family protein deacetylase